MDEPIKYPPPYDNIPEEIRDSVLAMVDLTLQARDRGDITEADAQFLLFPELFMEEE